MMALMGETDFVCGFYRVKCQGEGVKWVSCGHYTGWRIKRSLTHMMEEPPAYHTSRQKRRRRKWTRGREGRKELTSGGRREGKKKKTIARGKLGARWTKNVLIYEEVDFDGNFRAENEEKLEIQGWFWQTIVIRICFYALVLHLIHLFSPHSVFFHILSHFRFVPRLGFIIPFTSFFYSILFLVINSPFLVIYHSCLYFISLLPLSLIIYISCFSHSSRRSL